MRNLGANRAGGAAGVRANGNHDYYHPGRTGEHDKNHNGKKLLRAPLSSTLLNAAQQGRQLTFRET